MRFDSQFYHKTCQIFSWLSSSGARGGSRMNDMLLGTLSYFGALPAGLIEH